MWLAATGLISKNPYCSQGHCSKLFLLPSRLALSVVAYQPTTCLNCNPTLLLIFYLSDTFSVWKEMMMLAEQRAIPLSLISFCSRYLSSSWLQKDSWRLKMFFLISSLALWIFLTIPSIKRSVLGSIVVSIPACHAGDRGSIPRRGAQVLRVPKQAALTKESERRCPSKERSPDIAVVQPK